MKNDKAAREVLQWTVGDVVGWPHIETGSREVGRVEEVGSDHLVVWWVGDDRTSRVGFDARLDKLWDAKTGEDVPARKPSDLDLVREQLSAATEKIRVCRRLLGDSTPAAGPDSVVWELGTKTHGISRKTVCDLARRLRDSREFGALMDGLHDAVELDVERQARDGIESDRMSELFTAEDGPDFDARIELYCDVVGMAVVGGTEPDTA